MTQLTPGTQEWLDQVVEDIVEPDLPILDPHHHMWPQGQGLPYTRNDLHRDAGAGHNVVKTIFMECGSAYNREAPEHLRSLGETKYIADEALSDPNPLIAGIVSHIDLRRDDRDELLGALGISYDCNHEYEKQIELLINVWMMVAGKCMCIIVMKMFNIKLFNFNNIYSN